MDIRISNVHLKTSQMDIQYSNIKRPSDNLPDGYSIFEYQTSIPSDNPPPRWIFDIRMSNIYLTSSQMDIRYSNINIRISNIHLKTSQMDIRYSNIKRPSDNPPDEYSVFECQPPDQLPDGYSIFEYQYSNLKRPSDGFTHGHLRWMFDIRISNIHLGGCQMNV